MGKITCRKWRKVPPGDQSQTCRCESQLGGFAKGRRLGDPERGVWIPLYRPKLSGMFHTLVAILLNAFLSWDLQALGLEAQHLCELNGELHELVCE